MDGGGSFYFEPETADKEFIGSGESIIISGTSGCIVPFRIRSDFTIDMSYSWASSLIFSSLYWGF